MVRKGRPVFAPEWKAGNSQSLRQSTPHSTWRTNSSEHPLPMQRHRTSVQTLKWLIDDSSICLLIIRLGIYLTEPEKSMICKRQKVSKVLSLQHARRLLVYLKIDYLVICINGLIYLNTRLPTGWEVWNIGRRLGYASHGFVIHGHAQG